MEVKVKGNDYSYFINEDQITICKKEKTIYNGKISGITIISFIEKNILGVGQIAISLPTQDKPILDSFRNNDRENFITLFKHCKKYSKFLNMSLFKATFYKKDSIFETEKIIKEKNKLYIEVRKKEKDAEEEIKKAKKETQEKEKVEKKFAKSQNDAMDSNHFNKANKNDNSNKRQGCVKKEEIKCTCLQCNNFWFFNQQDKDVNKTKSLLMLSSLLAGGIHLSSYYSDKIKDYSRCPNCGSKAIKKSKVYYWINRKGDCLDIEEK